MAWWGTAMGGVEPAAPGSGQSPLSSAGPGHLSLGGGDWLVPAAAPAGSMSDRPHAGLATLTSRVPPSERSYGEWTRSPDGVTPSNHGRGDT